jgi:hypothetical protein
MNSSITQKLSISSFDVEEGLLLDLKRKYLMNVVIIINPIWTIYEMQTWKEVCIYWDIVSMSWSRFPSYSLPAIFLTSLSVSFPIYSHLNRLSRCLLFYYILTWLLWICCISRSITPKSSGNRDYNNQFSMPTKAKLHSILLENA